MVGALMAGFIMVGTSCSELGSVETETREDRFAVGEAPSLVVKNVNGRVEVRAGDPSTIHVRATLKNPSRVRYEVGQSGDTVLVKTEISGIVGDRGADIVVTAPPSTTLDVNSSNGSIVLRGMEGSGVLNTSNAELVFQDVNGDYTGSTSNGRVFVKDMEGMLTVKSSNGSATLEGARGTFDVSITNGRISFNGELLPGGANRLKTSNGSVTVKLGGTPSVRVDASTGNGSVVCKLPIEASVARKDHLVGVVGAGEADLTIETSNGDVSIE